MLFEDLKGKRFNSLLVIEVDKIENGVTFWICKCDCGVYKSFRAGNIKNGNTKSCHGGKIIDLTGKVFGNLLVIKRAINYYSPSTGRPSSQWLVECICGKRLVVRTAHLKTGHTVSCHKKSESVLVSVLKKYFKNKSNAQIEYKILKNPKTGMWLPYDIYIPFGDNPRLNGLYIEVHGEQHYKFVKYFHKTVSNFENQRKRDRLKKNFAKKNGTYIEINANKITFEKAMEVIQKGIKDAKKKKDY